MENKMSLEEIIFKLEGNYLNDDKRSNKELREEAILAIHNLYLGCVPEAEKASPNIYVNSESDGFNACRALTLQNMEKVRDGKA